MRKRGIFVLFSVCLFLVWCGTPKYDDPVLQKKSTELIQKLETYPEYDDKNIDILSEEYLNLMTLYTLPAEYIKDIEKEIDEIWENKDFYYWKLKDFQKVMFPKIRKRFCEEAEDWFNIWDSWYSVKCDDDVIFVDLKNKNGNDVVNYLEKYADKGFKDNRFKEIRIFWKEEKTIKIDSLKDNEL